MQAILLGIFAKHVETFGLIIIGLLGLLGLVLYLFITNAIKKIRELEVFHDDVVAVKLQDEGRKSFTSTLLEVNFMVKEHEKRLNKIDERCERRGPQTDFAGEGRRK